MKVFVAGATGAIGEPLVRELSRTGHDVSAITRSQERAERLRSGGVDAHVGDALDRGRLLEILERAEPEVMVHQLTTFPETMRPLRTLREWRQTVRLRVEGTRLFADLAKRVGARRIVAQSIAFGYKPLTPVRDVTEDDPFFGDRKTAMDYFMRHLLRVEETVTNIDGIEGVALRYGGWYGPGTHFARGGAFHALAMKRRIPLIAGRQGMWNAIHVDDAAASTVAALTGPTGVFNVVDDDPKSWNDFITAYCSAVGAPAPRTVPRWSLVFGTFYLRHLALHQMPVSNAKAKRELGWQPRYASVSEGFVADAAIASRP